MSAEIYWLVVRSYRGKKRVLSMHADMQEAATAYKQAVADMRDGDVILFRAPLEKMAAESGGYNRTKW